MADNFEEVEVKIDEGKMLSLGTSHPQRNREHLSVSLTYCEPLPKVSNFEIRAFKERVQDKSEGSPPN